MSGTTKQTGVYKIINIINSKFYIGSTSSKKGGFKDRIKTHTRLLTRSTHCNKHLQAAWNKYGPDAFKFEILEVVDDVNKIIEREQYYINTLNPCNPEIGYNQAKIANSQLGYKHTAKTKEKMRLIQLKYSDMHSKLMKLRMQTYRPSEETKQKISKTLTGIKRDEHFRKQISLRCSGRKLSEETKKKISNAKIGIISEKRKKVMQMDINGNEIKIWNYAGEAEKELKIPRGKISAVCLGNRNITGGYKWKYFDE